jgi:hypothetical protein
MVSIFCRACLESIGYVQLGKDQMGFKTCDSTVHRRNENA